MQINFFVDEEDSVAGVPSKKIYLEPTLSNETQDPNMASSATCSSSHTSQLPQAPNFDENGK